jgi:peroxiredoxin
LGEAHNDIRAAGGDVVAVFQYPGNETRDFCRGRRVPFDCLGDPQVDGYAAVGLGRGRVREYLGPQLIVSTLKAAAKGHLVGNPKGGDISIRPATFVVDREGRVAYAHYNEDAADNAPEEEVTEAVRRVA